MSYYTREHEDQIYADIAFRLGKVLDQYDKALVIGEKYEVTLCLSALQTMLTICSEYSKRMMNNTTAGGRFYGRNINEVDWLSDDCWTTNFEEERTLKNFITSIRNSLAHPCSLDLESEYPATGYSSIDVSDTIESICFVNSPECNQRNTYKSHNTEFKANNAIEKDYYHDNKLRKSLKVVKEKNDKYFISRDGETPFIRISKITLNVEQLRDFTVLLANFLAHPLDKEWGGDMVNPNFINEFKPSKVA